jgi:hypothetical protein
MIVFILMSIVCVFCWMRGVKHGNIETIKRFRDKAEKMSKDAKDEYYKLEKELNG